MLIIRLVAVVLDRRTAVWRKLPAGAFRTAHGSFVVNLSRVPVAWSGVWCAPVPSESPRPHSPPH